MIVGVVFKNDLNSKVYFYYQGDFEVKPMDKVLVHVGDYGHIEVATVVIVATARAGGVKEMVYNGCPSYTLKTIIAPADYDALLKQMNAEFEETRCKQKEIIAKYEKLLEKVDGLA